MICTNPATTFRSGLQWQGDRCHCRLRFFSRYSAAGGVTVNCICPGWTETAIIEPQVQARAAMFDGDRDKGVADLLVEKQHSRRTSNPSEIGLLALWLCDAVVHNVTGNSIPVDGGWTAQ